MERLDPAAGGEPGASFVPVPAQSPFPLQNLPYGIFRPAAGGPLRAGVRIGDHVLDLAAVQAAGLLRGLDLPADVFARPVLNPFMAVPGQVRRQVRRRLQSLLSAAEPALRDDLPLRAAALVPAAQVVMALPAAVGDYTDFYSSREHATNVGVMFRGKDNPLLPNWLHLPVGYHGRASSLMVSGAEVVRPCGQFLPDGAQAPRFGPSRQLDFELEVGFLVAGGNDLGRPIPVDRAAEHIFGLVLVNDWSARDLQKWEYQPLGPFNGKNFATSLSPWVVTLEALAPFRCPAPAQDPQPLPYLAERERTTYDIELEVALTPGGAESSAVVCRSNFRHLYWTMAQQLAHHTAGGCNLVTGDLLASGTISGPQKGSYGSLLELTWAGSEPLAMPDGSQRTFLQDGDTVTMTGWCRGPGYRVGFGEVSGRIAAAGSAG